MKAIVLPDYNANIIRAMKSLEVKETNIPKPSAGQVLVKVSATPCNPSDIAFMRGGYNIRKSTPVTMGFECSGTVVEAGSSFDALQLLGKRVSCFSQGPEQGTWAEYFATDWQNCIPIRDELDFEQAAALCVNPFTAYALFLLAREKGCEAVIQNGASGQIGVFTRRLAHRAGMQVINIVRKEEHVASLKADGERHVLNMTDPEFETSLMEMAHEFEATLAYDAVGGDLTGVMLNAMPPGAEIIVYGGLSGKPIGMINPLDVIFRGKVLKGFNLGEWKASQGQEGFMQVAWDLQELILKGVLRTSIQGVFQLEEVHVALEQYIRNMSAGKILFRP
jgi:NADPH:quinone reductase-like Zn-dependent oxidoreductase